MGRVAATLGRSDKWLAQTPQMFRIGALLHALEAAGDLSDPANALITDESSAMERTGPCTQTGTRQRSKFQSDLSRRLCTGRSGVAKQNAKRRKFLEKCQNLHGVYKSVGKLGLTL